MNHRVLVVAAHPDDEILGCGGTILHHINNGDLVHELIMAEGITSRGVVQRKDIFKEQLDQLKNCTLQAARKMGVERVRLCSFPDNRMDSIDLLNVIKEVEAELEAFQPDIVYTHHWGDVNIDHKITHEAVVTACRFMPGCCVKRLLFFEICSSTEWQIQREFNAFLPNWFVNIEETIDKKIETLHYYESEMREYPHPRSYEGVKALAAYRGIMVGCQFAEAFSLGREFR